MKSSQAEQDLIFMTNLHFKTIYFEVNDVS